MDTQELARWAIRLCVTCYVLSVTARLWFRHSLRPKTVVVLWSLGCLAYLVHIALAFSAFHDWSHRAAVEFTAEETRRVLGIRRGEGVWVNYVFAVTWIADCFRIARSQRNGIATSKKIDVVIDGFFALMMFAATVVFGPHFYRILFAPLAVLWIWMWLRRSQASNG